MLNVSAKCTGCQACSSSCPTECIKMEYNVGGFVYPSINTEKCIDCGICERICPASNHIEISHDTRAFAVKNLNAADRVNSASGGVFPLIAKFILKRNGVVFGAAYDGKFRVSHIRIENIEDIVKLQSAKYTQSILGNSFKKVKEDLENNKWVVFSGTPCQCAGLKTFLRREYSKLITIDLICHGVPSPVVWETYVKWRSEKENKGQLPLKINMRSKYSGWSRFNYSTEFDYGNGKIMRTSNSKDLFMQAFVGNLCLRKSCSQCMAKGIERCSDFTLGDYWGIWEKYAEFDDDQGVSVVLIHSEKAEQILDLIKEDIEYMEVAIEDTHRRNPSMVSNSQEHINRNKFLQEITTENFEKILKECLFQKEKSGFNGKLKRIWSKYLIRKENE